MPGFASPLITSGANGVLQCVWPVPDLPKALLAECVDLALRAGDAGPAVLRSAQNWYLAEVAPALAQKELMDRRKGVEDARGMLARMCGLPGPLPSLPEDCFGEKALNGLDPFDPLCFAVVNWYGV
jgi:hypothetical protein